MTDIAVKAEGLSKLYRVGTHAPSVSLAETITTGVKRLLRGNFGGTRSNQTFWALKDVSFEVRAGERIGVIGRNGAGKSTLLKLLSRITRPTSGHAVLNGRVGSLLEVGTGFHPELTGRENIYLNGAILGLSTAEIRRKFDQIVDFAGVEMFIDTPVKRYSSGMSVRLAFAVAAHLEPEILIVDEVLAVGDASFQRKSIGRMEEAANSGRTILFVSHSMPAVRKLCQRCLYLEKGMVKGFGPTDEIIEQYLSESIYTAGAERVFPDRADVDAVIRRVAVTDALGQPTREHGLDSQVFLEIDYELKRDVRDCMVLFAVSRDGVYVYQSADTDLNESLLTHRGKGSYRSRIPLPRRLVTAGTYSIYPAIAIGLRGEYGHDGHPDAISFTVSEEDQEESTDNKSWAQHRGMMVVAELPWLTEPRAFCE